MSKVAIKLKEVEIDAFLNDVCSKCDSNSHFGKNGRKGRYEVIKELYEKIKETITNSIMSSITNNKNNFDKFVQYVIIPYTQAIMIFGKNPEYKRALKCFNSSAIAIKTYKWSEKIINTFNSKDLNNLSDEFDIGITGTLYFNFIFSDKDGASIFLINLAQTYLKIIESIYRNEEFIFLVKSAVNEAMDTFLKTSFSNNLKDKEGMKHKKLYSKSFKLTIVYKLKYALKENTFTYKSLQNIGSMNEFIDEMEGDIKTMNESDIKKIMKDSLDTMIYFKDHNKEVGASDGFVAHVCDTIEKISKDLPSMED